MSNSKVNSTRRKKAEQKESGCYCYIGPTVVGTIQYGAMYGGSKEEVLALPEVTMAVEKYPAVADLIVAGDALTESKAQIKSKCGALYRAYRAVQQK